MKSVFLFGSWHDVTLRHPILGPHEKNSTKHTSSSFVGNQNDVTTSDPSHVTKKEKKKKKIRENFCDMTVAEEYKRTFSGGVDVKEYKKRHCFTLTKKTRPQH